MAELARRLVAAAALALASVGTVAQPAASAAAPAAVPTAADPVLEARMLEITSELRCLVCQNQTIADSHADLAADLRRQVREMLQRGQSPEEIRRYMTVRYGDFILYRPPLKPTTVLLWAGPALLLILALGALVGVIARRSRLGDERFEPDPAWDDDATDGAAPAVQPGKPA